MEAFALITTGILCTGHSRRFYHVAHVYSGSPWRSRARTSRFRRDSRQPNYWVRNIDLDVRLFDGRTEVFVPLCVLWLVSHFATVVHVVEFMKAEAFSLNTPGIIGTGPVAGPRRYSHSFNNVAHVYSGSPCRPTMR